MYLISLPVEYLYPIIAFCLCLLVLSYLFSYFVTYSHLRGIPSAFPAQFTNLWAVWISYTGKSVQTVHQLHVAKGKVVRIQPNHVSIADDKAIQMIYGHSNRLLKTEFYDAFSTGIDYANIFSTRDRADHAAKRKMLSHAYSPTSLAQLEPYARTNVDLFVKKLDRFAIDPKRKGHADNLYGVKFNIIDWFHYLAFDIISDLSFGAPLNMLQNEADLVEIKLSATSPTTHIKAIEALEQRTSANAALGHVPFLQSVARWPLPRSRLQDAVTGSQNLLKLAYERVAQRLEHPPPSERYDLLARIIENCDQDASGRIQENNELVSAAFSQLIAGSDTTSNSLGAIVYYVTKTPHVAEKLRDELDAAIPANMPVPTHELVRRLPYLNACIKESLRLHSMVGFGLPRKQEVSASSGSLQSGLSFEGHYFPPGTVLSVPAYTIHHSEEIWGPDANEFKPERWKNLTDRQKGAFIPFSVGPRACLGRNLAEMELQIVTATIFRRYLVDIINDEFEVWESFLRRPLPLLTTLTMRV